ncbi:hypothetical protein D1007_30894 [Hordeum vulgare]|nr:hypothetical protein D1007_30894 [Hordeum vulgare]
MPAGVTFRAAPFTTSSKRVAHTLVMRYDAFDCVNDNTHRLEDAAFPTDGSIISFGSHRIYVAVVAESYPTDVAEDDPLLPASDGGLSYDVDNLCCRVEALTATSAHGTSCYKTSVRAAVESLRTPMPQAADPTAATQELENHHEQLLREAETLEVT